ncbi:MAG: hypothetical protein ACTSRI_17180 [Promethearchaeota archaeon]
MEVQILSNCKYLLIQDPNDNSIVRDEDFLSIDRLAEKLDKFLEINDSIEAQNYQIDSEVEFWAHCLNIQAWAENNYDTQMLHANLSFPLLKKLTIAGDPLAKEVFKREIFKRFKSGNFNVMTFLIKEGYLDYFDWDEIDLLYKDVDFDTRKELQKQLKEAKKIPKNTFIIEPEEH